VSINCAAIPDSLLESELFGFERGAFTGAHASCEGKLKLADRGTVFFDEIGDMSPYAQAKILRAIECHELQRLGARRALQVDIRVIAATNLPIEQLAAGDRFRKDLFFRLNVAHIHLPPLRERKDDLLTLVQHFVAECNRKFESTIQTLSAEAIDFLFRHSWPGNIRELKNLIESAFLDLPHPGASHMELPAALSHALRRVERTETSELNRLVRALSETCWNKSQAAKRLQWSRMTLYRKMRRYHLLEKAACP
jgi:transcriptional regulator with PAS, ATPase and Fis domain